MIPSLPLPAPKELQFKKKGGQKKIKKIKDFLFSPNYMLFVGSISTVNKADVIHAPRTSYVKPTFQFFPF